MISQTRGPRRGGDREEFCSNYGLHDGRHSLGLAAGRRRLHSAYQRGFDRSQAAHHVPQANRLNGKEDRECISANPFRNSPTSYDREPRSRARPGTGAGVLPLSLTSRDCRIKEQTRRHQPTVGQSQKAVQASHWDRQQSLCRSDCGS